MHGHSTKEQAMTLGSYSSISDEDRKFVETWESVTDAQHYIVKEDRRGDEAYTPVLGHRQFKLTTYERMLTQDKVVEKVNDPFVNGSFRPVIVPENLTIETNPNALSNEDIHRIFAASQTAWEENLALIDAPATLQRMINLAEESDSISFARVRELEAKYAKFSAVGQRLTQADQEEFDKMGPVGSGTPSTSPGTEPRRRRTGGTA